MNGDSADATLVSLDDLFDLEYIEPKNILGSATNGERQGDGDDESVSTSSSSNSESRSSSPSSENDGQLSNEFAAEELGITCVTTYKADATKVVADQHNLRKNAAVAQPLSEKSRTRAERIAAAKARHGIVPTPAVSFRVWEREVKSHGAVSVQEVSSPIWVLLLHLLYPLFC